MLLYKDKEVQYLRKQFHENLRVNGIDAKLYPINRNGGTVTYDFYNDIKDEESVTYGDPVDIKIVFQEVPQINTLRNLGWYVKDNNLPYLAYVPTEYIDPYGNKVLVKPIVDDKIILVENPVDDTRSEREFLIKDFKSQGYPNTIYYICRLVPNYVNNNTPLENAENIN